jgi:hypothetical protein
LDQRIADYINANRARYTREAITAQLEQAGHDREAIDAAWNEVAKVGSAEGEGRNLGLYVWIVYWLGGSAIAAITIFAAIGSGGGSGFTAFGIGWLVAYLALTYLPARALARARPTGMAGFLAVVVVSPLVVVLIGGGICLGTVMVFIAGLGWK